MLFFPNQGLKTNSSFSTGVTQLYGVKDHLQICIASEGNSETPTVSEMEEMFMNEGTFSWVA